MTLNDLADEVFVINLNRRPDRLELFQKQALKFNFTFERWNAIDAQEVFNFTNLRAGESALLTSYAQLLTEIKRRNLSKVLICEDDVFFVDDLNERLKKEWVEIPEYDMIYLGCTRGAFGAGEVPSIQITDSIVQHKSVFGMHCHLITTQIYDDVLNLVNQYQWPLDVLYTSIQQKYRAFGFTKNLAKQQDMFSDIILQTPRYCEMGLFD